MTQDLSWAKSASGSLREMTKPTRIALVSLVCVAVALTGAVFAVRLFSRPSPAPINGGSSIADAELWLRRTFPIGMSASDALEVVKSLQLGDAGAAMHDGKLPLILREGGFLIGPVRRELEVVLTFDEAERVVNVGVNELFTGP